MRFPIALLLLVSSLFAQTQWQSDVLLSAPWGKEAGAFGHELTGARLGPAALTVTGGKIYLLDRVYGRVQIFSLKGKLERVVELGRTTVDLLAVDRGGRILVLDAFVQRQVLIYFQGKLERKIALPPRGRSMPTGIFAGCNGVLVEWDHGRVEAFPCPGVQSMVGSPAMPAPGKFIPGRPTSFGWVRVSRSSRGLSFTLGRNDQPVPQVVSVPVERGVECILGLAADATGRIMTAYFTWGDPLRRLNILFLSATGKVLTRLSLPDQSITDIYTRLSLNSTGQLFQMTTAATGLQVRQWTAITRKNRDQGEGGEK